MLNAPSAFVIEPFFGVFAEEFTFLLAVRLAGRLDFDLVDLPLSFAIVRAASCYIGRRTGSRLLFFTCGRRSTSRRGVRRRCAVALSCSYLLLYLSTVTPYIVPAYLPKSLKLYGIYIPSISLNIFLRGSLRPVSFPPIWPKIRAP